jgi:hypothetical protein
MIWRKYDKVILGNLNVDSNADKVLVNHQQVSLEVVEVGVADRCSD